MNRAEMQMRVSQREYNLPLPKNVIGERLILSLSRSTCCVAEELLVRSRSGSFVARDCLACGARADYAHLEQIPDLDCEGCAAHRRTGTAVPIMKHNNYWYRCEGCRREWEIGSIVPEWSDAFQYSGLAAPGDPNVIR